MHALSQMHLASDHTKSSCQDLPNNGLVKKAHVLMKMFFFSIILLHAHVQYMYVYNESASIRLLQQIPWQVDFTIDAYIDSCQSKFWRITKGYNLTELTPRPLFSSNSNIPSISTFMQNIRRLLKLFSKLRSRNQNLNRWTNRWTMWKHYTPHKQSLQGV